MAETNIANDITKEFEAFFWSLVDKTGEHWLWQRGPNGNGYGSIGYKGRTYGAHVMAFILTKGDVPSSEIICHKCDVRLCCNPAHLYSGTFSDNNFDMYNRGRQTPHGNKGTKNASAKINDEIALEIRRRYDSGENRHKIARFFGVSVDIVSQVGTRRTWKHLL